MPFVMCVMSCDRAKPYLFWLVCYKTVDILVIRSKQPLNDNSVLVVIFCRFEALVIYFKVYVHVMSGCVPSTYLSAYCSGFRQ